MSAVPSHDVSDLAREVFVLIEPEKEYLSLVRVAQLAQAIADRVRVLSQDAYCDIFAQVGTLIERTCGGPGSVTDNHRMAMLAQNTMQMITYFGMLRGPHAGMQVHD